MLLVGMRELPSVPITGAELCGEPVIAIAPLSKQDASEASQTVEKPPLRIEDGDSCENLALLSFCYLIETRNVKAMQERDRLKWQKQPTKGQAMTSLLHHHLTSWLCSSKRQQEPSLYRRLFPSSA